MNDEWLDGAPAWPLSRLFHENTKLSPRRNAGFQERIAEFSADPAALAEAADAFKSYPTRPLIDLPRANRGWFAGRKLRELLASRRSQRGPFGSGPVTREQLGGLLETACGITGRVTHPEFEDIAQDVRAQPSGGGLYPIEVYPLVLRVEGVESAAYHYQPRTHQLARLAPLPPAERLNDLFFAPGLLESAAMLLVLTGVFARTQIKYGERGYRIVLLDAGHLAQNLLLAAADHGLSAAPLGGFHDDAVAELLEFDVQREAPLHAVLIGSTSTA